ncbi:MAG: BMP family ABC transporter substrate-binding protein [Bacillales bacterium]|nr:BMP family ABC transporter substrate-binding protein [Bacillales bacterium]
MKRIFALLLLACSTLLLAGCAGTILENAEKDYYAVGQFNGWGTAVGDETYKMTAIAINDERVASIKAELKGATALYILQVVLPATDAGWSFEYKIDGEVVTFNGNLAVKVVRTAIGDPDTIDFWAQNKESGAIDNLTPDTLYLPPYQETATDGEGTWGDNPGALEAGTYYVVYAELEDGTKAMGLVPVTEIDIALVTDVGNIDDKSFNEGAWNGVIKYAEENNLTYAYWRPNEDSTAAREVSIKAAIAAGADVVVCPGYLFEEAIYNLQSQYPDVAFLLLDGEPHTADYATYYTAANTCCILYQEEQAGYLAGYAAVMEGYTKLGFIGGMSVPAVVRYGYGYVQGAEAAAVAKNVNVTIKYNYAGTFSPSADLKTKMDAWYAAGTEVVFSCGGGIYLSVVAAAEATTSGKVIGVDVDQSAESDRIITSAEKKLVESTYQALTSFYDNDGAWDVDHAGITLTLGAAEDCVGLPTSESSWRLTTFTVAEYNTLFASLKDGSVVVNNSTAAVPAGLTHVTVDYNA